MGRLDGLDLSVRLSRDEYAARLDAAQRRWLQLRLHIGGQMGTGELGPGLLFVFEGPDAAGKGGAIKRVVEPLDPRHYRVSTFAKPTFDEKRHPFLWRFYRLIPGLGGMSVFDRSWYGRVLVERIEGFATTEQWGRAYEEIVSFERTLVLEGVILVKFWLHISDEEQLRGSRTARPTPCGGGRSPRRTGATASATATTTPPPRRCSSAPTTTSHRGTSSRASTSARPGCGCWRCSTTGSSRGCAAGAHPSPRSTSSPHDLRVFDVNRVFPAGAPRRNARMQQTTDGDHVDPIRRSTSSECLLRGSPAGGTPTAGNTRMREGGQP